MESSNQIIEDNESIPNACIRRIIKDVRTISKSPLDNIYYEHSSDNVLKGNALIIGPSDTPYHHGYYLFKVKFTNNYPYEPPVLTFMSNFNNIRMNPNLYRNGKVCLSILNTWNGEQWTSCQTLSTILLTLSTILNENPLSNEPGIYTNDPRNITYNQAISYVNIKYIICEQINNIMSNYKNLQDDDTIINIYNIILHHFSSNYKNVKEFVKFLLDNYEDNVEITSGFYSFSVKIELKDLDKTIQKLATKTKKFIKTNDIN